VAPWARASSGNLPRSNGLETWVEACKSAVCGALSQREPGAGGRAGRRALAGPQAQRA